MRINKLLIVSVLSAAVLASCDSGNIPEVNYDVVGGGRIVKMTATVSGVSEWTKDQSIALAGFNSESQYAVTQRTISNILPDNSNITLLQNAGSNIETVELVVTNKLRKRILTLKSIKMADFPPTLDTIRFDLGTINLGMLSAIQYGVFNNACIQCHGGNGFSAAGLQLTEGNSYNMLVDVPSAKVEGATRVVSGDADNSLIKRILSEGGESLLHYNHTEILSSQFKYSLKEVRELIDNWINSLNK